MPALAFPELYSIQLISGSLPASQVGMSEPISLRNWKNKTIYVSADKNTLVYVLVGADPDHMCKLKSGTRCDTEDSDREWDCNNELIAFEITEHTMYFSLVVKNEDTSNAAAVKAWIS